MKNLIALKRAIYFMIVIFFCSPCYAGPPTEKVRDMLNRVMFVQTDPQLEKAEARSNRRTAIKQIISENFDFDSMPEKALGTFWNDLEPIQRGEFKAIFQDLFQDSYTRMVLDLGISG